MLTAELLMCRSYVTPETAVIELVIDRGGGRLYTADDSELKLCMNIYIYMVNIPLLTVNIRTINLESDCNVLYSRKSGPLPQCGTRWKFDSSGVHNIFLYTIRAFLHPITTYDPNRNHANKKL